MIKYTRVIIARTSTANYSGYVIGKIEHGELRYSDVLRQEGETEVETNGSWDYMEREVDVPYDEVTIGDYIAH